MNGLKYIRTRCNLSLSDLAESIGVTRQALSSWENERKEIPSLRIKELSNFFGIDEEYFGEISETEKKYLLEKAMFRYENDGKETYRYKPQEIESARIFFPEDSDKSLDEKYVDMQKRKKKLLREIEKSINYTENAGSIQSQICCINRGCNVYGMLTMIMQEMKEQQVISRMPYFYEIINVLKGMLVAYDLLEEDVIKENIEINKEFHNEDGQWILELAGILKSRWSKICEQQEALDKQYKSNKKSQQTEHVKPIEEQILDAENSNRELKNQIGEKLRKLEENQIFK